MSQNSRRRVKELFYIFGTCVLIAASIYLVQMIGLSFQSILENSKDAYYVLAASIAGMLVWGTLIFIIVMVSPPFRKLLFAMFGEPDKPKKSK